MFQILIMILHVRTQTVSFFCSLQPCAPRGASLRPSHMLWPLTTTIPRRKSRLDAHAILQWIWRLLGTKGFGDRERRQFRGEDRDLKGLACSHQHNVLMCRRQLQPLRHLEPCVMHRRLKNIFTKHCRVRISHVVP